MIKNFISIFIIFSVSVLLSLPLLKSGFYTVHDDQQFARLFELDKSIKTGQIPPRWVEDLGFGFGYPLFVFYPPFVYYLGEVFHILGFGFIDSIKLVFFVSIFTSGLAMYILVKEFWGKLPATIASLFYICVPYRALDMYVRGALAESFSFVWLPLIIWSFYKLQKTQKSVYTIVTGIFLALLVITHNLIFLPFMLILPIFILYLLWQSQYKKQFVKACIQSFTIAVGLSAFFTLPALLEKKFTIVDQLLLVNLASYKIHFVYPQQLWNWPWGFGGSAPGLADGISFKIGKIHIIIAIVALLFSILHWFFDKAKSKPSTVYRQLSTVFFLMFIFSVFMTTFYSQFIWDKIPPLWYLQFPWRFLIFAVLFSSILAGGFIYYLRIGILKIVFGVVLISLLVIPNLKLFRPQGYRTQLTDKIATSKEVINWDISSSSFEYSPKGVELYKNNQGANVIKISKLQIPIGKIEIINGTGQIDLLKDVPSNLDFVINSKENIKLKANIFNFPGWQAKIDGKNAPIKDDNNLKLITLNLPSGSHHVNLEFENTPDRIVANLITLITFIVLASLALFNNNRRRNIKKKI